LTPGNRAPRRTRFPRQASAGSLNHTICKAAPCGHSRTRRLAVTSPCGRSAWAGAPIVEGVVAVTSLGSRPQARSSVGRANRAGAV
jgi:hypothetical protein